MIEHPNMVAFWRFEGNATDNSKNTHNGTVDGATITTGRMGDCYDFDGTDDDIAVPDSSDFTFADGAGDKPFSITVWFKNDTVDTGNSGVIAKYSNIVWEWCLIIFNTVNYPRFLLRDDVDNGYFYGDIQVDTDDATWHHLAFTYDGSEAVTGIKGYLDGIERTIDTFTSGTYTRMRDTAEPVAIGTWLDEHADRRFDGKIDEIVVWNKELSEQDVKRVMLGLHPL